MAENILPEVIPGMVAVEYTGADNKDTGETKGFVKNVFPIDAKELIATGNYKLVDNGAVEAARLAATPLRRAAPARPDTVITEVAGVAGEVVLAPTPEEADKLAKQARTSNSPDEVDKADAKAASDRAAEAKAAQQPQQPQRK